MLTLAFWAVALMSNTANVAEKQAWEAVLAINRTWASERDLTKLATLLHPDMVLIDPVNRSRLEGRDAIVASYRAYLDAVPAIHHFRERDPRVQIYGGRFAVVTYYWDMSYVPKDGTATTVSGRDMYVLVHENGRWLAVADQFSEFPKSS
jgi:uncharacterized protein (TIGR02246 family)